MKSTKVKIGFLLAALAAVLFTGCNQLTTKNVGTEFGMKGRKERIADKERELKTEAWNTFYSAFTGSIEGSTTPYNLQNGNVTKGQIEDKVKAVNAFLQKQADPNQKDPNEHKFPRMKKPTTVVYAKLTYTGEGETKDLYKDLKTLRYPPYTDQVAAKFSQKFNIEIIGGDKIGQLIDEETGVGK